MWSSQILLMMSATGCCVVLGFSTEGKAVMEREEGLVTMKVLNCRKNEACDEVEESMRMFDPTRGSPLCRCVIQAAHRLCIVGDRVATSIR